MGALRGPRRWAYQAFRTLPEPVRGVGDTVLRRRAETQVRRQPGFDPEAAIRLVIGPLNTAGQGERWTRAAETLPGVSARSMSLERRSSGSGFGYASDWHLSQAVLLRGMTQHRSRVLGTDGLPPATHVLAESAWAVLADPYHRRIHQDLEELRAAGISVAILIHGSEMRDLRAHAAAYPHSPFHGDWDERWETMHATVQRTREIVGQMAEQGVPLFVPTQDMLEHVPGSTLLPITVDVDRFSPGAARGLLLRARPVVLHAPSNPRLKGTRAVEEVLGRLHQAGMIEYRRLSGVPNAHMPSAIAGADIVVDQIVLGNVATLAAESMAAGRIVVAHVADEVRERQPGLPVVEANPDTLEEVIRGLLEDRPASRELAAKGPAWAREHHDGTAAAAALSPWLLAPRALPPATSPPVA
ncbi:hypothetical protein [Ornithinimicrobium sp. Y1694]|uniref:hypothetical protein n=1 Tax=Ornithinimicrobium sp. Y1694 TaxID=3418590 RepID=UPI003CE9A9DD